MLLERAQGGLPMTYELRTIKYDIEPCKAIYFNNGKELEEPKRLEVVSKKLDECPFIN